MSISNLHLTPALPDLGGVPYQSPNLLPPGARPQQVRADPHVAVQVQALPPFDPNAAIPDDVAAQQCSGATIAKAAVAGCAIAGIIVGAVWLTVGAKL